MSHFYSDTTNHTKSYQTLIDALRSTSHRLSQEDVDYQWGHMGQCNAGHLIQTITGMSSYEIVESIDFHMDEWSEHATDYCTKTGCKVDDIFQEVEKLGMSHQDIVQLEYLSNRNVLNNLKGGYRTLQKNNKIHVIQYMESYADLLERK